MTPGRRLAVNMRILERIPRGSKVRVTELMGDGPRMRRVFEFARREGDTLICLDGENRVHKFALRFVSCAQNKGGERNKDTGMNQSVSGGRCVHARA